MQTCLQYLHSSFVAWVVLGWAGLGKCDIPKFLGGYDFLLPCVLDEHVTAGVEYAIDE